MSNNCNDNASKCATECDDNNDCCDDILNAPCPVEMDVKMQTKAFFAAMQCAQTEIIKKKIIAAWGDKMEKKADAVVEAMGKIWMSKIGHASAQCELKEAIKGIYQEDCK